MEVFKTGFNTEYGPNYGSKRHLDTLQVHSRISFFKDGHLKFRNEFTGLTDTHKIDSECPLTAGVVETDQALEITSRSSESVAGGYLNRVLTNVCGMSPACHRCPLMSSINEYVQGTAIAEMQERMLPATETRLKALAAAENPDKARIAELLAARAILASVIPLRRK